MHALLWLTSLLRESQQRAAVCFVPYHKQRKQLDSWWRLLTMQSSSEPLGTRALKTVSICSWWPLQAGAGAAGCVIEVARARRCANSLSVMQQKCTFVPISPSRLEKKWLHAPFCGNILPHKFTPVHFFFSFFYGVHGAAAGSERDWFPARGIRASH